MKEIWYILSQLGFLLTWSKRMTKSNLGGKGIVHLIPLGNSSSLRKVGQELQQKPQKNASYWLVSMGLLSLICYESKEHWSKGATTRMRCAQLKMLRQLDYIWILWRYYLKLYLRKLYHPLCLPLMIWLYNKTFFFLLLVKYSGYWDLARSGPSVQMWNTAKPYGSEVEFQVYIPKCWTVKEDGASFSSEMPPCHFFFFKERCL